MLASRCPPVMLACYLINRICWMPLTDPHLRGSLLKKGDLPVALPNK